MRFKTSKNGLYAEKDPETRELGPLAHRSGRKHENIRQKHPPESKITVF